MKRKFSVLNGNGTKEVIEATTRKKAEKEFKKRHGGSIIIAHEVAG